MFSKIWKTTSEKSHFCPDETCFAAQKLLIFFQNHIIIMMSDIKTQFSLDTFHPETKKNILQKSKILKNNFKSVKKFKRFFIAKGSLTFSKIWNPEEECLRAGLRADAEAEADSLTGADAEADPGWGSGRAGGWDGALRLEAWAWALHLTLGLETWRV